MSAIGHGMAIKLVPLILLSENKLESIFVCENTSMKSAIRCACTLWFGIHYSYVFNKRGVYLVPKSDILKTNVLHVYPTVKKEIINLFFLFFISINMFQL